MKWPWQRRKTKTALIVSTLESLWVWLTIGAMIVTTLVALWMGSGVSIWFDEGYSIMVAQRPIHEIFALTAVDAHPPLYYLFLKLWGSLFGWDELVLRSSSAIIGGLTIGAMTLLIRQLFTTRVALAVLPFLVLAPFLTRYNYELRMYALVTLIGVIATWCLYKAQQSQRTGWWVSYGVLVVIGMYTLYLSAVIWLAHLVWLLYVTKSQKQSVAKQKYWLVYGAAAVAFIPWVPTVIYQLLHSALPPYVSSVTVSGMVGIASFLATYEPYWKIGAWASLGLVVGMAVFGILYAKIWRVASMRIRRNLLLLVCCFLVGIVFYCLISLPPSPPRFMTRYVVHIAIFAYALIAVVVALGWKYGFRKLAGVLGVLTIALFGAGLVTLHAAGNYNFERLQSMQSSTIRQSLGCDNTTYVSAGAFGYIDMRYEFDGCELKFYYPHTEQLAGGYAPLNGSQDRIMDSQGITTQRLVFVYFDDSTEIFHPDNRYTEKKRQSFDKTRVIIYEK